MLSIPCDYFWRQVMVGIVKKNNVLQPHRPPLEEDYAKPILARRRYPPLGASAIFMSEQTPVSEKADRSTLDAIGVVLQLKEWLSVSQNYPRPWKGTGSPYPREYQAIAPKPELPEDFRPEADKLAGVACRGPFSLSTKKDERGDFMMDLSSLEDLQPRAPFVRVGGLARFKRAPGGLATTSVAFRGRTYEPSAHDWSWTLAEKRMLVALNTYTTVMEHLVDRHMIGGGTWAICTLLALSPRHPLRVLMQLFMIENMRVNNDQIDGLLKSELSNVPGYSGYPLALIGEVIRDGAKGFDARMLDPEQRAKDQGQLDDPAFPTVASVVDLWRIYRRFALKWCSEHLRAVDLQMRIWCEELDDKVPNGVRKIVGLERWDDSTIEHVAHLAAIGMFAGSVGHYVVNDLTGPYQMQFHVMPPAMDVDGYPTEGIVYEKRNSILVAGQIKRYMLLDDAVSLPTPAMRTLWTTFQDELKAYEQTLLQNPTASRYRVFPSRVTRSIHA